MCVHRAVLAGETFLARGMEVELDELVGLIAEGDAVGAGCCVELNCVAGVDDIDGERLIVDLEAGHIGWGLLCTIDIDR